TQPYLARAGMTDRELRKLRHDIKVIATEAEQRGFTLHADEKMVLNAFECGDLEPSVAMRYFYFGSPSCPTVENLTCVAEAIVSRAWAHGYAATREAAMGALGEGIGWSLIDAQMAAVRRLAGARLNPANPASRFGQRLGMRYG